MTALVFVDTGALIGLFVAGDQHHARSTAGFQRLLRQGHRLFTSSYVFDELLTRVKGLAGSSEAFEVGRRVLASTVIRRVFVDEALEGAALRLFERFGDKDFSFTDVVSLALMQRHGVRRIFTFDAEFAKAGYEVFPGRSAT